MAVFCDQCTRAVPASDDYFTMTGGAVCSKCRTGERIDHVTRHIEAYHAGEEDFRTLLVDLLADAMHACESRRINFGGALRMAEHHYQEEKRGRI